MGQPDPMVGCLQERGWEVIAHPDGSYSAAVPDEQLAQFEAAEAECVSALGFDQPVTRAQAEAYFDALLAAADCVRDLGYQVAEPPSRQAAIEEILRPVIDLGWDPYEAPERSASSAVARNQVYAQCPRPSLFEAPSTTD